MAKKEEEKKVEEKKEKKEVEEKAEAITGIVHLVGKDVNGALELPAALRKVKGVGYRLSIILSEVISKLLSVSSNIQIGKLREEQIKKVEDVIRNPTQYGIPEWMINRQKEFETGKDVHLVGSDLTFAIQQGIEREKTLYTWRGFRHIYGKKVRGQHTRTGGRKGLTMGVARRAIREAKKAAGEKERKKK